MPGGRARLPRGLAVGLAVLLPVGLAVLLPVGLLPVLSVLAVLAVLPVLPVGLPVGLAALLRSPVRALGGLAGVLLGVARPVLGGGPVPVGVPGGSLAVGGAAGVGGPGRIGAVRCGDRSRRLDPRAGRSLGAGVGRRRHGRLDGVGRALGRRPCRWGADSVRGVLPTCREEIAATRSSLRIFVAPVMPRPEARRLSSTTFIVAKPERPVATRSVVSVTKVLPPRRRCAPVGRHRCRSEIPTVW